MSDSATYNNWLVSLESDNFSMFVKTWFAFLASVRELVLAQATDVDKQTLMAAHGDKTFLDEYNKKLSSVPMTPIMRANIEDAFSSSRTVVRLEYPEYYFQTYYKKITPFSFCKKEIALVRTIQYKFDIDVSTEAIHIGVLVESKSVAAGLQNIYIQKKIPISELTQHIDVIDKSGRFYSHIKTALHERFLAQIKPNLKQSAKDRVQASLSALCQVIINRASDNTSSKNLYENMFCLWCDEMGKPPDSDLKEWFIGFCYNLRNVLFHRTIDPFDSRWSHVMKACYQGLREFLLANSTMLNELKVVDAGIASPKNKVETEMLKQ